MSESSIFPSTGMRLLSAFIELLGVSILTHCLSRRLLAEDLSNRGLRRVLWPRLCIILVFLDSWLFLFTTGVLIFGIGLEKAHVVCSLAIYSCICFYATSKIFIYLFFIERVYVVWSPTASVQRFKTPVYVICVVKVTLFGVIAALLLIGRIHEFRKDGVCVIGLKPLATIPLLAYDLYVNLFLTSLFLWPIFRTQCMNASLKRVATRTLVATIVSLTTSTVNVLVIILLHGKEVGWVCLGCCGIDIIFSALALYWVTSGTSRRRDDGTNRCPHLHPGAIAVNQPSSPLPSPLTTPTKEDFVDGQGASEYRFLENGPAPVSKSRIGIFRHGASRHDSCSHMESSDGAKRCVRLPPVMADIFRRRADEQESRPVEITVTTELEIVSDEMLEVQRLHRSHIRDKQESLLLESFGSTSDNCVAQSSGAT